MNSHQQGVRSWVAEPAMIIAAVTITAYFWTLRYEAGVCAYFQIPLDFVSLNPTLVIFTSAPFFYVFSTIIVLGYLAYNLFDLCLRDSRRFFIITSFFLAMFLAHFAYKFIYTDNLLESVTAGVMILAPIIILIAPYWKESKLKGCSYWKKLEANLAGMKDYGPLNYALVLLFLLLFWSGSIGFGLLGTDKAKIKEEFSLLISLQRPLFSAYMGIILLQLHLIVLQIR